ncbi:MAG: tetratricopeptide repeat protein [Candidatus Methanoperedens sp.]|nr:tetratricopeptide repeat protein [Candidatus Methanoperedens sp.]MCZ7369394.1 tetratricopeptide repeat protein [Candidatus Methanoperedens sp.]
MDNKAEEFLKKLAPCIERGELEACVEEAARVAREMGIGAEDLLDLSVKIGRDEKYESEYIITLAAALGLEGENKARAYSNAGIAANYIGKFKESEDYYKKAIQIDPKDADAHYNYANLLEDLGRKIEAEEHYEKAIKLNPKDVDFHNNYALLLVELGKKAEAIQHYKKAIELDPKYIRAQNNYALLLKKLGRKNEAEEYFKRVIELNPKYLWAHNNYAIFLREKKLFIEAENEVRTSLKIEPTNFHAHIILGDILSDEKYFEMAEKEYHEALKNSASIENASISENHNKLGYVYVKLKQYEKAKKEFKMAIDFNPMNMKARRNLRELEKFDSATKISGQEISKIQIFFATVVLLYLIISFYLFLTTTKFSDVVFAAQSTVLIALLILILLYHQFKTFKFGPSGIEVEKSEYREAKSSAMEAKWSQAKGLKIEP